LRAEVESLLAHGEQTDSFIEAPAMEMVARELAAGSSSSEVTLPAIGTIISHYRIVKKIGKGGMGEVFQAKDQKLGRDVAIKVLPEEFAKDADRVARFQREAKLLASLNHPNIAAIYGLEEADGKRFLVLELVKGETLAQRLSKRPLPVEKALEICRQIAEGLEAAHEKGVIHRDLKPANVMITAGDKVKILDFGLAKALADETQSVDSSQSPTITEAMTKPGVVLGTAAYMSPEQAKGKAVDKRADIWAFGCILYECLTGKRVFEGETVTETLAAVLTREPNWQALPATTPPDIRVVLRRCLEKEMSRRFHHAADVRIEIEEAPDIGAAAAPPKRPWLAWGIVIVGVLAALTVSVLYFRQASVEAPETRLEINTPPTSDPTSIALSPDGRLLVFVASSEGQQKLWLRPLDAVTAQPLSGTEGATYPFWSPDSRSIGFFAGAKLKRIDIAGGPPQVLASAPLARGGTWNRDGVIVFVIATFPLHRVPDLGGDPVAITRLDPPRQSYHSFPKFLPDGRRLLYFAEGADPGIYLTSLDSGETRRLIVAESPGVYAPPGYLLFIRQATLFAQRFDAARGAVNGDPIPIANSVSGFSVSETGMLAYRTVGGANRWRLAWFDRSGKEVGTLWAEFSTHNLELSPNGRRVAVDRDVQGNTAIWLIDAARGVPSRLTFNAAVDGRPIWSPDGSRIVFWSNRKGTIDLYQKASSGAGSEEPLLESALNKYPQDWSPDGRFLLYLQRNPKSGIDLWVLPLFGERKPFPFSITSFDKDSGQFSPDGRWVAYHSNESGRFEVYVQPFPGPGGKWQVSTGGGIAPRWRRDGKELFYIAPDGKLMAAPIHAAGQTLDFGSPVSLFQTRIVDGGSYPLKQQYAVAPDGQRFLINIADESTASPITIVTNWARALKK
jgi:serine/threonine protein kinase